MNLPDTKAIYFLPRQYPESGMPENVFLKMMVQSTQFVELYAQLLYIFLKNNKKKIYFLKMGVVVSFLVYACYY